MRETVRRTIRAATPPRIIGAASSCQRFSAEIVNSSGG